MFRELFSLKKIELNQLGRTPNHPWSFGRHSGGPFRLMPRKYHIAFSRFIVRVHYFVRGGFVGHRSRASSKHLSPHLPVDELDSSGVKKGLRCSCKMHVWVSGPQRSRLDVDVSEK
ncbi:hypothetical protein TNCV_1201661 [Trichonephila clavipes]|nr:hypothetical protein TNCV_1201661 [Trichonephila clavipes]